VKVPGPVTGPKKTEVELVEVWKVEPEAMTRLS
jgi:hypothetical protein